MGGDVFYIEQEFVGSYLYHIAHIVLWSDRQLYNACQNNLQFLSLYIHEMTGGK